jgi:hypothetical protein
VTTAPHDSAVTLSDADFSPESSLELGSGFLPSSGPTCFKSYPVAVKQLLPLILLVNDSFSCPSLHQQH